MNLRSELGLHRHIMPGLQTLLKNPNIDGRLDDKIEPRADWEAWLQIARDATVFDCRSIDIEFAKQTGAAVIDEWKALGIRPDLPFPCCYFEFEDTSFLAGSIPTGRYSPADLKDIDLEDRELLDKLDNIPFVSTWNEIEFKPFISWWKRDDGILEPWRYIGNEYGKINDEDTETGEYSFLICGNTDSKEGDDLIAASADVLCGILSLMSDKLVAQEFVADPAPKLNKARAKRGKPPISGDRIILTINAGAVRRIAQTPVGTHESPRLHWRRGHWRVIHRFSEFEKRTWVNRCLVGDPDRGFVAKDYRVVFQPPLLEPVE